MSQIEKALIDAGVKNLREFGYPTCTPENILTDAVYRKFFASMLESNRGRDKRIDKAIDALLSKAPATNGSGDEASGFRNHNGLCDQGKEENTNVERSEGTRE